MKKRPKQSFAKIITLLVFMSVFLIGCKKDVPASATVEDTTGMEDELLTENTKEDTESPEDKDNADELTEEVENDTEVPTENPDEDTKVDNSESIEETKEEDKATEDTSSETKQPEETTSSETQTPEVPKVEEPATPPAEPTPPPVAATVPSVHWDGGGVTLPTLGITIPTLRDFNDEALTDNTNNTFWTGDNNDVATAQTLANSLESVRNAMVNAGGLDAKTGQGFAVEQYKISFGYGSYSATMGLELYRNPLDATYTLNINYPLDTFVVGVHELAPYTRDALLTMCSIFSSQPQTVYSTLYEDLYGTECISMTSYTSVGDCKIKYDNSQSYDGHYVYLIK